MSLREEQESFAKDTLKLFQEIFSQGFTFTYGEVARTLEQQKLYLKLGRSKTLKSNHLVRCAIDLNIFKSGILVQDKSRLQKLGDFWESLDPKNRWGGNFKSFKDLPHFERNVQ
jgi:hypothetical protein